MKLSRRTRTLAFLTVAAAVCGLFAVRAFQPRIIYTEGTLPPDVQEFAGPIVQAGAYRLSGPYTHENLTLFLVHGTDQSPDPNYLTLQEALEQKKAIVHETERVSELAVENLSAEQEIYLQSGDIVKGGKQDRAVHYDLVLAPKSGKVPLASFCVEQSRWSQRGSEKISYFSSSPLCLSSKELKLATRYDENQAKVWARVAAMQDKLKANVGPEAQSAESASSLALTLETNRVQDAVQSYLDELSPVLAAHPDAIGFVFTINGQLNSAEVYGSSRLFRQLWPKLLRASAVEACAESKAAQAPTATTTEAVHDWLKDGEGGKAYLRPVGERMETVLQEGNACLLFETRDRQRDGTWVHRTYLAK
jgi:hypothetical protein